MRIGIANDHHGIELKKKVIKYFKDHDIKYSNYGSDIVDNVDYVDYAIKLCDHINKGNVDLGILICGTGIGMSIVANKINGILAARVVTPRDAMLAREHNHANVITFGEDVEDVEGILDKFINTKPSEEERHIRRVNKINSL